MKTNKRSFYLLFKAYMRYNLYKKEVEINENANTRCMQNSVSNIYMLSINNGSNEKNSSSYRSYGHTKIG